MVLLGTFTYHTMYGDFSLYGSFSSWACALASSIIGTLLRSASDTVCGSVARTPWSFPVRLGFHGIGDKN